MMYDCVIIGSGVAGLTAALYLGRANKKVLIIENGTIGGTTAEIDVIENYPGYDKISGKQLIGNMVMQVVRYGINIDVCDIKSIDFDNKFIKIDNNTINYKTLIIASGMTVKKLNIENEAKFKFKGLSYCAVCDGALYKNKKIIVITEGNTAIASVNYLKNITKDLIVLDLNNKFVDNSIQVINNIKPIKIIGDKFVSGIEYIKDDQKYNIGCDAVFVSIGKYIDLKLFNDKININNFHIITDESMHTNIDGVFAAGDIRDKELRQIVTACSDGAIAATEAVKLLTNI